LSEQINLNHKINPEINPNAVFQVAVNITLAHEGGYSFDPADPGGETKFGISKRAYPDLAIADLTGEDAARIYFLDFWCAAKLDKLAVIAPDLAIKLFDLGVNCGPKTAVKFLQQGVNTVCCGEVAPKMAAAWRRKIAALINGKPLRVDGHIGPVTLGVIETCPHDAALMAALKGEAYRHYKAGNPLYVPGWLNRLET